MNKLQATGLGVGMFILGFIVAPSEVTKTETIEVPAQCEQQVCNADEVRGQLVGLRDIDNRGFELAGKTITTCSEMVMAAGNGDLDALEAGANKVDAYSVEIEVVKTQRDQLLKQVGL